MPLGFFDNPALAYNGKFFATHWFRINKINNGKNPGNRSVVLTIPISVL
jgi:hypothetical protein